MNPFASPADDLRDTDSPYAAAACAGMVELYEEASMSRGVRRDLDRENYAITAALSVCNGDDTRDACPIRDLCLLDTLAWERGKPQDAVWSVRGGMTERQRFGLHRAARKARR